MNRLACTHASCIILHFPHVPHNFYRVPFSIQVQTCMAIHRLHLQSGVRSAICDQEAGGTLLTPCVTVQRSPAQYIQPRCPGAVLPNLNLQFCNSWLAYSHVLTAPCDVLPSPMYIHVHIIFRLSKDSGGSTLRSSSLYGLDHMRSQKKGNASTIAK